MAWTVQKTKPKTKPGAALFEPKARFKGCPPVCLKANLPSFKDAKHISDWRKQFGGAPDHIKEQWLCEACGHLHYLTIPRDPSGDSSGTGRGKRHAEK